MIALKQQHEPTVNVKALAWTIGVHLLLLLLFFLLRYTVSPIPPAPVVNGGGLEVNLGTSETGSGNDQPMKTGDPAAYQATVVYKTAPAAESNLPKDMMQSTTEADAPVVDNTRTTTKGKSEVIDKARTTAPKEKPKYTYQGDAGPGGNAAQKNAKGGNEGITGGPGDQGVPGGTPGAANYSGTPGNGNGGTINHTLTGRDISPSKFEAEFREGGKVVIHVTVDRTGNIIDKRIISSSSSQLTNIALDKLNRARFTKGEMPEQSGDVTIIFKTRQ